MKLTKQKMWIVPPGSVEDFLFDVITDGKISINKRLFIKRMKKKEKIVIFNKKIKFNPLQLLIEAG